MTSCDSTNRVDSTFKWSFVKFRWFLHIMEPKFSIHSAVDYSSMKKERSILSKYIKQLQLNIGAFIVKWIKYNMELLMSPSVAIYQEKGSTRCYLWWSKLRKWTFRSRSIFSILSASDCGSNSSPIKFVSSKDSFWKGKRPVDTWFFWAPFGICWLYTGSLNWNAGLGFRRTLMAFPAKRIDSATRIWTYSGSISCRNSLKEYMYQKKWIPKRYIRTNLFVVAWRKPNILLIKAFFKQWAMMLS